MENVIVLRNKPSGRVNYIEKKQKLKDVKPHKYVFIILHARCFLACAEYIMDS